MSRARYLVLASVLVACSPDVAGRAPAFGDVVDVDTINLYQAAALTGPDVRPECADGRCIEIRFADYLCRSTVRTDTFDLFVTRGPGSTAPRVENICGQEAFDAVFLANSIPDDRGFLVPTDVIPQCREEGGGVRRFDTAILHLSEVGLARILEGVDLSTGEVSVSAYIASPNTRSCPGASLALVQESGEIVCDPNCRAIGVEYSYALARAGFATSFVIANSARGVPPRFESSTLRTEAADGRGLLRTGECPPGMCSDAWSPTLWWPPHGEITATFAEMPDGVDPVRIWGMLLELEGRTYTSPADLRTSGAPLRVVTATGADFSSSSCDGSAPCTFRIIPTSGAVLPPGLQIDNFELVSDDTLLDPMMLPIDRLSLPAATQSEHGNAFDRGPSVDAIGGFAISLVQFDDAGFDVPTGGTAMFRGHVVTARGGTTPDRVELRLFGDSLGDVPLVGGAFAISVTGGDVSTLRGYAEVLAYSGTHFVGYDRVPVTFRGPDGDGDGIDDAQDNCPDVPNPDQTDLDGAGPGLACEGLVLGAAADSDGDGARDTAERGLDAYVRDVDRDGLDDGVEIARGTDPHATDTDGDGLTDAEEGDRDVAPVDGILDALDPDNSTVGLDPSASVFLIEEDWTVDFDALGLADLEEEGREWRVGAHVTFRLTYGLAVGGENWFAGAIGEPIPAGYADTGAHEFGQAFRLDSIGVSYLSNVEVRTDGCANDLDDSDLSRCRVMPVAPFACQSPGAIPCDRGGDETFGWGVPGDDTERVSGDWQIEFYPNDGWREPYADEWLFAVPDIRPGPMQSLGTWAYYGGADVRGNRVDEDIGTRVQVASLRSTPGDLSRTGLVLGVCRARVRDCGPGMGVEHPDSECLASAGICDPIPIAGNVAFGSGIPIGAFGNASRISGDDPAHAATWEVDATELLPLLRGESGVATGSGDLDLTAVSGGSRVVLMQDSNGETTPATRFSRSVTSRITSLGPVFVDGVPRDDRAFAEGTDTVWNGRIGYRAQSALPVSRSAGHSTSTDWFRAHVALAGTYRPDRCVPPTPAQTRAQQAVERLLDQCQRARGSSPSDQRGEPLPSVPAGACQVHLRVNVANVPGLDASGCGTNLECADVISTEPRDGIVFSEAVPLERLHTRRTVACSAPTAGVRVRWTGQMETQNTLNTLADDSTDGNARIQGCASFPAATTLMTSRGRTGGCGTCGASERCVEDACVPSGVVVHPGRYEMFARFAPTSVPDATIGSSCADVGVASWAPRRRSAGARRRIAIGYPIVVRRTPSGTLGGAITSEFGPQMTGEDYALLESSFIAELRDFWRDIDTSVDVSEAATSGFDNSGIEVLPPYALMFLATTTSDADTVVALYDLTREVEGATERAAIERLHRRPLLLAAIDVPRLLGNDVRLEEPLVDAIFRRQRYRTLVGTTERELCRYVPSRLPDWEGMPRPWAGDESDVAGRTFGSVLVHESGHLAGLQHVLLAGPHLDESGAFREPECYDDPFFPVISAPPDIGVRYFTRDTTPPMCTDPTDIYAFRVSPRVLYPPILHGLQFPAVDDPEDRAMGVVVNHPLLAITRAVSDEATACAGDNFRGTIPASRCGPATPLSTQTVLYAPAVRSLAPQFRHVVSLIEPPGSIGGRQRVAPASCGGTYVVDQRPSSAYLIQQFTANP